MTLRRLAMSSLLAVACTTGLLQASPTGCFPIPATIPNTFGTAALGSTAAICGNVTAIGYSHETAFIDATHGTELASTQLNPFVGVIYLHSGSGLVATDGSALRFAFDAPKGTQVSFDHSEFFDQFATAFAFVVLDGTVTTLAEQHSVLRIQCRNQWTSLLTVTTPYPSVSRTRAPNRGSTLPLSSAT